MLKKIFCFFVVFILPMNVFGAQVPSVSGKAAVVIEMETGKVIFNKNAYSPMAMASTTKIMTAICTIENINTNIPITVSDSAVGTEGSSLYLKKGEVITVKELLYGMMLNSGNDAAVALAMAVSGSVEDFCVLMNKTAKNIGAQNTNFTNPSGLYDENHYTTAFDLALITAYAMKNPLFQNIVSTKEAKISMDSDNVRYLKNHNKLLWLYNGCIGVKTGFTKKSGRCLVSACKKDGVVLICVSLNAPDDWNDHKKMFDYGFLAVTKSVMASPGEFAANISSNGLKLPLYFDTKVEVAAVPPEEIEVSYTVSSNITLPVYAGHSVGRANFIYNGRTVASSDLVLKKDFINYAPKTFIRVFNEAIKKFVF